MAILGPQYYQQQINAAFKKLYQRISSSPGFQYSIEEQKEFITVIAAILAEGKVVADEISLDERIDLGGTSISIQEMLKELKLFPIEEALIQFRDKYHFKMTYFSKDALAPMTSEQKANPLGAHLLHHYYTTSTRFNTQEKKAAYPIYNINSAKEIPLIMHCAEQEGLQTYGIVVVTGSRHRTPILIHNNEAYIFESLGTARSKVGVSSVAQIGMALQKNQKLKAITTFKENRQVDSVSCGSESFMALKEAFRAANGIETFTHQQEPKDLVLTKDVIINEECLTDPFFSKEVHISQLDVLPPQVAKYSQAQSSIERYPKRFDSISRSEKIGQKTETVQEYAKRHQKVVSIDSKEKKTIEVGDKQVELKGRKMTVINSAVETRREKHAKLVTKMLKEMDVDALVEIVKESSGINLITKHLDSIPPELFEIYGIQKEKFLSELPQDLVTKYVFDEMSKKRDEKTGIAPNGICSLTELAYQLKQAPKPENKQVRDIKSTQ
jgi:hypothetical protein